MDEKYGIATVIGMLTSALGAFLSGRIMLTSTHEKLMEACEKRTEDRLREERVRVEDEQRRADRWMEIGMKATGVSEELIAVTKTRESVRDARDLRREERERR